MMQHSLISNLGGNSWLGVLAILAIGLFLGIRHATDPDHVIAVSTILTRERKISRATLIGALWGVGHTFTILLAGAAIILFRIVIPPRIGLTMEFSVAAMLIVLGIANLRSFRSSVHEIASHEHSHSHLHSHDHCHDASAHESLKLFDHLFGSTQAYWIARPVIVGVVHGLAGSAAVALLVLSTISNPRWAIAYLLIFGIGTIAGMVFITAALASALSFGLRKSGATPQRIGWAAGLISLAFGAILVYQIGFVQGLFTAQPHWIPR